MSRERELLERAYQYIPLSSVTSQEIRDFLSTPEPTQDLVIADYATSEPVGGSKMELTTEPTQDEEP